MCSSVSRPFGSSLVTRKSARCAWAVRCKVHKIVCGILRRLMASAVAVSNLYKRYDTGTEALKGVTLSVQEGDFFALLGPNGAGKTTLIGILSGLVEKTSGDAAVFGHDVNTDASRAKTFIGLVPQELNFNIFEKVENIITTQAGYYGIPREQALKDAEPLLKNLGLWDKRHEVSQKL